MVKLFTQRPLIEEIIAVREELLKRIAVCYQKYSMFWSDTKPL